MKKIILYPLFTILLASIVCACSDHIAIKQDYDFEITHLPVPKKLKKGEVAEIRCRLIRSGQYADTRYYLRYFQSEGKGELWLAGSEPFLPNDTYQLPGETFRLYFRSLSEDSHTLDIVFFDSFGKETTKTFSFANAPAEDAPQAP
jgi:hypothetical protein